MATNTSLSRSVPQLTAPSLSAMHLGPKHIEAKHLFAPGKSFISSNRPKRVHVKDLGDVLFGDPIMGTKQMQEQLDDYGMEYIKYVPLINRVAALGAAVWERQIEPIAQGKPHIAFINGLESTGRTFDILANPVKSLMPWAGGGKSTDLAKSMGWLDGEYRETYKWDTGNWLLDVVGETISDPLNWATWGAKAAGKAAISPLENLTFKTTADFIGKNDAVSATVLKNIAEDVFSDSGTITNKIFDILEDNKKVLIDTLKETPINSVKYTQLKELLTQYTDVLDTDKFYKLIDIVNTVRNTDLYSQYKSIAKILRGTNDFRKGLTYAASVMSPSWGLTTILKDKTTKAVGQLLNNSLKKLDKYKLENPTTTIHATTKYMDAQIAATSYSEHKELYDKFINILGKYDYDKDKFIDLWRTLWFQTPKTLRTVDNINAQFIEGLKKTEGLKEFLVSDEAINAANRFLNTVVSESDLQQLTTVTGDAATVELITRAILAQDYRRQVDLDMNVFFGTQGDVRGIKYYRPMQQMRYIDEKLLTIDGKHYGIAHLRQFLKDLNVKDPTEYVNVVNTLGYVGLTTSNFNKVVNLMRRIKAGETNLGNDLKALLTKSRTGDWIEFDKISKSVSKYTEFPKYTKEKVLNNFNSAEAKRVRALIDSNSSLKNLADKIIEKSKTDYDANIKTLVNIISEHTTATYSEPTINILKDETNFLDKFFNSYNVNMGVIEDALEQVLNENPQINKDNLITLLKEQVLQSLDTFGSVSNQDKAIKDINRLFKLIDVQYNETIDNNVFTTLDTLFGKYKGTAEEDMPSALIKYFLEPIDMSDVSTIDTQWEKLKRGVALWRKQPEFESAPADIKQMINDIFAYVNTKEAESNHVNFIELASMNRDYYFQAATNMQRADWIYGTVLATFDDVTIKNGPDAGKPFLDTVLDRNSKFGAAVLDAITILRNSEDFDVKADGNRLNNVYNRLIGTAYLQTLLNAELTDTKLPEDLRKYLRNKIYDGLVAASNKGDNIFRYIDSDEEISTLTNKIVKSFTNYNDDRLIQLLEEEGLNVDTSELRPRFEELSKLIEAGDYTDLDEAEFWQLKEYFDRVQPSVQERYDLWVDRLKQSVFEELKNYFTALALLVPDASEDIGVLYTVAGTDKNTIRVLKTAGENYTALVNEIYNSDRNIVLDSFEEFIKRMSSDIPRESLIPRDRLLRKQFFDSIQTINTNTKVYGVDKDIAEEFEQVQIAKDDVGALSAEQADYQANVTLSTALKDAFTNIDMTNKDLSGTTAEIALNASETDTIKSAFNYISANEYNRVVQDNLFRMNSADESASNGAIGVKKFLDANFIEEHNLQPRNFVLKNDTNYAILYNRFEKFYNMHNATNFRELFRNKWRIERLREALTQHVTNYMTPYAPKDVNYFKNLPITDILAWDSFYSSVNIDKAGASKYALLKQKIFDTTTSAMDVPQLLTDSAYDILENDINPYRAIRMLDDLVDEGAYSNEEGWLDLAMKAPTETLDAVITGAGDNLNIRMKNPAYIAKNAWYYNNYISRNVGALNRTRSLIKLENNNRLVGELDADTMATLAEHNIKANTQMNDKKVLSFMSKTREASEFESIIKWDTAQLRTAMDDRNTNILYVVGEENYINRYTDKELKEAGLTIIRLNSDTDKEKSIVDAVIKLPGKYKHKNYSYDIPKYIFQDEQDVITKLFKDNANYFNPAIPPELQRGGIINKKLLKALSNLEAFNEIRKQFDEDAFYADATENLEGLINNVHVVGRSNSYDRLLSTFKEELSDVGLDPSYMFSKTQLTRTALMGNINAIRVADDKRKYLEIMFNDDYFLGNNMWTRALKDASNEEIKDLFTRNNYVAAVLRQDKNGNPIIKPFHILDRQMLNDAIDNGAVILPYQLYRNATLVINKNTTDSRLLKFFKGTVTAFYKSMYLTSFGFLLRNELDSVAFKNANSSYGVASIMTNFRNQYLAGKMIDFHNEIQQRILDTTKDATFNRKLLAAELAKLTPEERDLYILTDMFMNSAASGGYSEALETFLKKKNLEKQIQYEDWIEFMQDGIGSFMELGPIRTIGKINSRIEQTARLGLFLTLMETGSTQAQAIRNIINTHFDYKITNKFKDLLEQFFWFSTFPINNMAYYLNEGMTKNPEMLFLLMDVQEASWDSQGHSWEELKNNPYLAYNALVGNIRFNFFGKDVILKTGSSVFDFFSLLYDPMGEISDRLTPFLAVLMGLEDPKQLNPFVSQFSRAKQFSTRLGHIVKGTPKERITGSFVPSVYSLIPHYEGKRKYPRRIYNGGGGTWTTYPRRPRRIYSRMRRVYSPQTYRYFFDRGRNYHLWLNRTSSIEPFWYHHNYYANRKNRIYTYPRKTYNHR